MFRELVLNELKAFVKIESESAYHPEMTSQTNDKQPHSRTVPQVFCVQSGQLKRIDVRRVRRANFPECISEYIVYRHLIRTSDENADVRRDVAVGDILVNGNKIEVKCTQRGLISFGPTETWQELYILHVQANQRYALY